LRGDNVPPGMRALVRRYESGIYFHYKSLAARFQLGKQGRIQQLVAHALLAPHGHAVCATEVGCGEFGDSELARRRNGRRRAEARLAVLPARLKLELAQVRQAEVV